MFIETLSSYFLPLLLVVLQTSAETNLPDVPPGVFNATGRIEINTTTAALWNAIVDFEAYPNWNPFVRLALVTSDLGVPLPTQYPVENYKILFRVQLPPLPQPVNAETPDNPLHTQFSFENVTHVQPDLGRLAWKLLAPDEVLDSERWTAVSVAESGMALYESREVYRGSAAEILKVTYGAALQEAFQAQAVALKALLEHPGA